MRSCNRSAQSRSWSTQVWTRQWVYSRSLAISKGFPLSSSCPAELFGVGMGSSSPYDSSRVWMACGFRLTTVFFACALHLPDRRAAWNDDAVPNLGTTHLEDLITVAQVLVLQGAFTLWNMQVDECVVLTANLLGTSTGRAGRPVHQRRCLLPFTARRSPGPYCGTGDYLWAERHGL